MSTVIAVDIGGTFTDLVCFDDDTRAVTYTKSPTTYGDFAQGILTCFAKAGVEASDVRLLNHGTTLVINALIQRTGARTALVTTRGFRDVLEIARGNRPDPFDLYYERDEPLAPRELRFEVEERMTFAGEVATPLAVCELDQVAATLRACNVEAVAVSFLNAYANPAHEQAAVARLRELLPSVHITGGADLSRERYEFERTATVVANAFVGPQVERYLRKLVDDLRQRSFAGSLYMMGSNGGLLSLDRATRMPIALIESGPIGGCIGAGVYAEALGLPNVIAFDMGGTTAKCAAVENGKFSIQSVYFAAGYRTGFPIRSPVIDIVEVGSGGGSVAWLDGQHRLHVGPRSAGSTPGPACYGRGGTEPTITDANLVLGFIDGSSLLGGEMSLDVEAARRAIGSHIAGPLGYPGEDGVRRMAHGILAIATVIMAGAVRRVSIEHGRDPRDFVLFAYGGGGPLHASALARELSIPAVVIPPEPGIFSAIGMLLADARIDESETFGGLLDEGSLARIGPVLSRMCGQAGAAISAEFGTGKTSFESEAEMRYFGQQHSIRVRLPTELTVAGVKVAFEAEYARRYGHVDPRAAPEFHALHVSTFATLRRPGIGHLPRAPERETTGNRLLFLDPGGAPVEATVYRRHALPRGFTASGPAVIEEYSSTTIVLPGDRFRIGELHEIRIDIGAGQS